ncbi:MAG: TRAP transporter permease DctM, partial [Hyphomicrobiales bacterium]
MLQRIDRFGERISFWMSLLASSTIAFFMLLICTEIILRGLFSYPLKGVQDFVTYAIVACIFVQLGSCVRGDKLIAADFLMINWIDHRPILANGARAVFFITATWIMWRASIWLWNDFSKSLRTHEFTGAIGAFQLTIWPFKLAVAVGCIYATIEIGRKAIMYLWQFKTSIGKGDLIRNGALGLAFLLLIMGLFVYFLGSSNLSPVYIGLLCFAGLFFLVACGMPVAFALFAMAFIGIWFTRGRFNIANNALGLASAGATRAFAFGVVPLFVMMGLILDRAGVGRDAFQVAVVMLHRVRGGLGIATVAANAVFAAITGSSIASAAVFSRIAIGPMVEAGYTRRFAVGVVAGSSVLGMLIPPSLLLIVYGLLSEVSIGKLFVAAIIPGLLLAFSFGVLNVLLATYAKDFVGEIKQIDTTKMPLKQMVLRLAPIIFLIFLIMGGIYGGFFSPTEAGAVGAFGAFLVAFFKRKLTLDVIKAVILDTGYIAAGILFLITAANMFASMLAQSTLPMQMTGFIGSANLSFFGFMIAYLAIVLLLGMILDSVSIMLIILPVALPVVQAFGG